MPGWSSPRASSRASHSHGGRGGGQARGTGVTLTLRLRSLRRSVATTSWSLSSSSSSSFLSSCPGGTSLVMVGNMSSSSSRGATSWRPWKEMEATKGCSSRVISSVGAALSASRSVGVMLAKRSVRARRRRARVACSAVSGPAAGRRVSERTCSTVRCWRPFHSIPESVWTCPSMRSWSAPRVEGGASDASSESRHVSECNEGAVPASGGAPASGGVP